MKSCTDVATRAGRGGAKGRPCLPVGRRFKFAEMHKHRFRGVPMFQSMGSQHQSEELFIDKKQTYQTATSIVLPVTVIKSLACPSPSAEVLEGRSCGR